MHRSLFVLGPLLLGACGGTTAPPPRPAPAVAPIEAPFPATTDQLAHHAAEIAWGPCPPGPASLEGCGIAVLEGDPAAEQLFTIRIRSTAPFVLPAHRHARHERVTVLEGAIHVGFGEAEDKEASTRFEAGAYYVNAAGAPHFVWTDGPVVLQITGIGPWTVEPVEHAEPAEQAEPVEQPVAAEAIERRPPVFTPQQIRAAMPVGARIALRVTTRQDEGVTEEQIGWEVVAADEEAVTIRTLGEEPQERRQTWEELSAHGAFPVAHTERDEEEVTVPVGTFDAWRYTVATPVPETAGEVETVYWFAKDLPGPPVRMVTRADGVEIRRMEMVERTMP